MTEGQGEGLQAGMTAKVDLGWSLCAWEGEFQKMQEEQVLQKKIKGNTSSYVISSFYSALKMSVPPVEASLHGM